MHESWLFCEGCVGEGEQPCSENTKLVYYLCCCYVHYLGQLWSGNFATGWLAAHKVLLGQLLHASQDLHAGCGYWFPCRVIHTYDAHGCS